MSEKYQVCSKTRHLIDQFLLINWFSNKFITGILFFCDGI